MSNTPPAFTKTYKAAGTPNVPYFSLSEIDPGKTGIINKRSFSKAIRSAFPDKDYDGLIILDWEGEDFNTLKFKPIEEQSFNKSIQQFIALIKYTRELRPKAQIGVWDLPLSIYYVNVDTTWRKRNSLIDEIIMECDVLMPNLYDYYPTGAVPWQDDTAYVREVLKVTFEKATKYNKAVMPFVWHRYSDAVEASALKAIEPYEFVQQMKLIAETSYFGRKVNGVIWWQEDLYYINIKAPNIMKEMKGMDVLAYREKVLLEYWQLLRTIFR
jgi:hypothetical protein